MECPVCNHATSLMRADAVHAPGKCEFCNCGESEVIHGSELVELVGVTDTFGFRSKPMRGVMIGEYGFEG